MTEHPIIMQACPNCGKENDDDWPVEVAGQIVPGGCQDCWEMQSDALWWEAVLQMAPLGAREGA